MTDKIDAGEWDDFPNKGTPLGCAAAMVLFVLSWWGVVEVLRYLYN